MTLPSRHDVLTQASDSLNPQLRHELHMSCAAIPLLQLSARDAMQSGFRSTWMLPCSVCSAADHEASTQQQNRIDGYHRAHCWLSYRYSQPWLPAHQHDLEHFITGTTCESSCIQYAPSHHPCSRYPCRHELPHAYNPTRKVKCRHNVYSVCRVQSVHACKVGQWSRIGLTVCHDIRPHSICAFQHSLIAAQHSISTS
jgi:hypothetical protein